jgi:hypothetical protein
MQFIPCANRRYICSLGCLIGRLLPRVMLKERGLYTSDTAFSATDTGKPYIAGCLWPASNVLKLTCDA